MFRRFAALAVMFAVFVPPAAYPQVPNQLPGVQSTNPAGLTLVPGTVVIPAVSGAANTGTVPLPGTAGSPDIPTQPNTMGVAGALYPPAYYPVVPSSSVMQATTVPPTAAAPTGPAEQPVGGVPTCLNVRYDYLCQR